ncbi:MAG: mannose-1-phosphate guanylyltransferase [Kiritimatiellia bacterium]
MPLAYAIIMAGGNGERFWPLSTPERPKQFLDLFGGTPLIRQAVDRLAGLIPPERTFVVTADRFTAFTREALPMLPPENVIGEPCRRDTAAAVATACGLVLKKGGPSAVGCILTADQLISPAEDFRATLADAIDMAARTDAIVTMGIVPSCPETGFGYIECGPRVDSGTRTVFHTVRRFVEKPNMETARFYLAAGGFLWNAGMFIWAASTMRTAFQTTAPDFVPLIDAVAAGDPAAEVNRVYPALRSISIDFAVMEHAKKILVAESRFTWDDVGSWTAVEHHFAQDAAGNTTLGPALLRNVTGAVVVNAPVNGNGNDHLVVVAGLSNVVVVHTPTATLVCTRDQLKNLKSIVRDVRAPN